MRKEEVKKRMMYTSGEDFYLFSYAIFITLDSLNCKNEKYFKDYRKLAFLIEFIKDNKLNYIISNASKKTMNPIDKEYLFNSYSVGLSRRSEVLKLLFTLEKKGYVSLEKGNTKSLVNVSLNKDGIPDEFLNKEVFMKEYKNIKFFQSYIKRLSTLNLNTMLDRVYGKNGINTWAV